MSARLWKLKAAQNLLGAKRTWDPKFLEVSLFSSKVFEVKSFEQPDLIVQRIALDLLKELRFMKLKAVTLRDSVNEAEWEAKLAEIEAKIESGDLECPQSEVC